MEQGSDDYHHIICVKLCCGKGQPCQYRIARCAACFWDDLPACGVDRTGDMTDSSH
jgi:hypothetical protein